MAEPESIVARLASLPSPHCEQVEPGGNTLQCQLCGADMPDHTFDETGTAIWPTDNEILDAHDEVCPWRCAVERHRQR